MTSAFTEIESESILGTANKGLTRGSNKQRAGAVREQ
jgi:hypothetical protein